MSRHVVNGLTLLAWISSDYEDGQGKASPHNIKTIFYFDSLNVSLYKI